MKQRGRLEEAEQALQAITQERGVVMERVAKAHAAKDEIGEEVKELVGQTRRGLLQKGRVPAQPEALLEPGG